MAYSTSQSQEEPIIADISEKKEDNNSFCELAINNDYLLLNQPISLLIIINEIFFLLINISGANILLLSETFHNLEEKKNF